MRAKLTLGLSDVLMITVIAWNRINSVSSLFFQHRILRFGKNMTQRLKRFLCNFNIVARQNSLNGFCNTADVRDDGKTCSSFQSVKKFYSQIWFTLYLIQQTIFNSTESLIHFFS